MARLGVDIITKTNPPPRSAPVGVGTWFVAGAAAKGDTTPREIRSMSEYERYFGPRPAASYLYDSVNAFFHEGGSRVFVSRVFGPTPTSAALTLKDAGNVDSITVTAKSPGAWGSGLSVAITAGDAGGEFKVVVSDSTGTLETSPSLLDPDAAVTWSSGSDYVTITKVGATPNDPKVAAAAALTGGTDDYANATDATWKAALDRLTMGLGSGMVSTPGRSTLVGNTELLDHAASKRRIAILDSTSATDKATLKTEASAYNLMANAKWGAMFGPWVNVPGLTPSTTLKIPASGIVAGRYSANLAVGRAVGEPAAGELGRSVWAISPSGVLTDAEVDDLADVGFNTLRSMFGGVRVYGWRSLAKSTGPDFLWTQLNGTFVQTAIMADAYAVLERYVLAKFDGRGQKLSSLEGELNGVVKPYWIAGDLFGDEASDAYRIEVGPAVNPLVDLQAGKVRAVIAIRYSPFAEWVTLEIVRSAITEVI